MTRARLLPPALVALLIGTSVAAPITLGRRFTDESSGFSIRIPTKWDQVPTTFREVVVVGKWNGPRKRGHGEPELRVLRFLRNDAVEDVETPREALERGIPGYAGMMRGQPRNVWEAVDRAFRPGSLDVIEDDPEFKIKSKRLTARVKVMHQKNAGWGGAGGP